MLGILLDLPSTLLKSHQLTRTSLRVMIYLAHSMIKDRTVSASQHEIAEAIDEPLRDIQHSFLQLQKAGYISWKNRGSHVVNNIEMHWDRPKKGKRPNMSLSREQPKIIVPQPPLELDTEQALDKTLSQEAAPFKLGLRDLEPALRQPNLTRAEGTPRAIAPLPAILARLSVLEDQHDSISGEFQTWLLQLTKELQGQRDQLKQELQHLREQLTEMSPDDEYDDEI